MTPEKNSAGYALALVFGLPVAGAEKAWSSTDQEANSPMMLQMKIEDVMPAAMSGALPDFDFDQDQGRRCARGWGF